jgi:cytochrome c
VWDAQTLDAWVKDPGQLIPHNRMTFPGVADPRVRRDLVAYLKAASSGSAPQVTQQDGGMGGGMGGMMSGMGRQAPDLKKPAPSEQVKTITYCRDTYHVWTADGEQRDFWERNLRLKTDSSDQGPPEGSPALVPAGMMGDRADIIFAKPEEMSGLIKRDCPR